MNSEYQPTTPDLVISEPEVERANILEQLEYIFQSHSGRIDTIVVQGPADVGKTTLLRQFSARHQDTSLCIFIRTQSRYAYDPQSVIYQIADQAAELLGQRLDIDEKITVAHLHEMYLRLQRRARRQNKYYYFIIDGLEDIPVADSDVRRAILGLLPFGLTCFRFLLSINPIPDSRGIGRDWHLKEFDLCGLSVPETALFFKELNLTDRQIEDIRRTCRGLPGAMASIRRSARNAPDLNSFISLLPQEAPEFFELEWNTVKSLSDQVIDCLAILAVDRKAYSFTELAEITNQDAKELQETLQNIQFMNSTEGGKIEYISEHFRQFAAKKLAHKYRYCHEKLIAHLLRDPTSDDALFEVPQLLSNIGKMEDLLKYLTTPEHFTMLLEKSNSITTVKRKTEFGIRAANELQRDDDLARFGLQLASTRMISGTGSWRSEIEARIALDDIQGALRLAHSAIVRESRFHMLVVIAKVMNEQHRTPDAEIMDQIGKTCQMIDFSEMGDRAFEIAEDLVPILPDIAMEIVETVSKRKATKPQAFDWALAKLSLEVEGACVQTHDEKGYSIAQSIQARITDPQAKQFARAVSILVGKYSADEVWAESSRIANQGNRVNYLRFWVVRHQRKSESVRVAEQTLQLAIGNTSYSLTASVLRDLATPLAAISDERTLRQFLSMLDAQRATSEKIGPTEDYFEFWLLLTIARSRIDPPQALSDVTDLYLQILYISELSIKAACMARLMAALPSIDKKRTLESSERLHSTIESDFVALVDELLSASADHIVAVSNILRALSKHAPKVALQICSRLNSPIRRDEARLILVRAMCQGEPQEEDVLNALDVLSNIDTLDIGDAARDVIAKFVFSAPDVNLSTQLKRRVAALADKAQSPALACYLSGLAYSTLNKSGSAEYASLLAHLREKAQTSWQQIDAAWTRIDSAFLISKLVAETDRDLAHDFIKKADVSRRDLLIGSDDTATAFFWCIKLIIVGYSGLFARHLDTPSDEKCIAGFVGRVPGTAAQASLWADLALKYYLAGRREDCVRIASRYLRPLVTHLKRSARTEGQQVIAQCMPAMYIESQLNAVESIREMTYPYNDDAVSHIKNLLLFQLSPFDVCESIDVKAENVKFSDIGELLELVDMAVADHLAYWIIDGITDALTSKKNKDKFSREQRQEFARRIDLIAGRKFPNPKFIRHDGWKVLADSCVAKIRTAEKAVWLDIVTRARCISNSADRVLVLEQIALKLPRDMSQLRMELFREACESATRIPVAVDRIIRLRAIAQSCASHDPAIARQCVTDAMKLAINVDDEDRFASNERRRLVDIAYKIDPKLAEEIADLGDNDPARIRARQQMSEEIAVLKLKRRIINKEDDSSTDIGPTPAQNQEAAWRTLAELNAGRVPLFTKPQARDHFRRGAAFSLEDSYPSFLLALSSHVRKYAGTDEARAYLRPMFDGLLRSTEIAWQVIGRTVGATPPLSLDLIVASDYTICIEPGEKEKAIAFIETWIVNSVKDFVLICDPYFGLEDMDLLQRIHSISPNCEIKILTSLKNQQQTVIRDLAGSLPELYSSRWRQLTEAEPPVIDIYVCQSELDNRSPLHDRWIVGEGTGLSIGSSFNSLGQTRCFIDYLVPAAARLRAAEFEKLVSKQMKTSDGQRVRYLNFSV